MTIWAGGLSPPILGINSSGLWRVNKGGEERAEWARKGLKKSFPNPGEEPEWFLSPLKVELLL